MQNPKLSVLIPTLNEEKYIGVLLNSLANQEFKDFEIIVADGNSDDKTQEVVSEFNDKLNIKFLTSDKRNVGYQRNFAAKNSTTRHFFFLDADTKIDPDFLSKIYDVVKNNDYGTLTSYNIPISKKIIDKIIMWVLNHVVFEISSITYPWAIGTFIYANREAFESVGGFDESITWGEDGELVHRIVKKDYRFKLVRNPCIYFSVMRFEKEGRLNYVLQSIKYAWHVLVKGPIKNSIKFPYDMSGKRYD
jgi:glycosyltransferase involved in cell wall biosynthesis